MYIRGNDNRGHRLCLPAQVQHHHRSGLRHAVRPAHHHRGQYPPEKTRRQESGRARRSWPQDTKVLKGCAGFFFQGLGMGQTTVFLSYNVLTDAKKNFGRDKAQLLGAPTVTVLRAFHLTFTCVSFCFKATVVQERRRSQQPHETGRHGQPRVRVGPAAAKLAVEVPVQQTGRARSQVQPEHVPRLDDQPNVQLGGVFQQPRQNQAVHIEKA